MQEFQVVTQQSLKSGISQDYLKQVLAIQSEQGLQNGREPGRGFLVSLWSTNELTILIENGSNLHVLLDNQTEVIAYALVSPISEFDKQLDACTAADFDRKIYRDASKWRYVFQMAIIPLRAGQSLGSQFLPHLRSFYPDCSFIFDFMIEPVMNEASAKFAKKLGSVHAGEFEIVYRGLPPSRWQIMICH